MKIETLVYYLETDLGSMMTSLIDKGFQSLLSQGDKNCKIKVNEASIEKCVILLNLFPNKIFYCIFKVAF